MRQVDKPRLRVGRQGQKPNRAFYPTAMLVSAPSSFLSGR